MRKIDRLDITVLLCFLVGDKYREMAGENKIMICCLTSSSYPLIVVIIFLLGLKYSKELEKTYKKEREREREKERPELLID